MDVFDELRRHLCWCCDGTGCTWSDGERRACAACHGTGLVSTVPRSTSEMASAQARLSSTVLRTFSADDMARIDEIQRIVITCLSEMDDFDEG